MGDVSWFRLQQEKEVAVFLRFVVVWEKPLLQIGGIFKVICDFVLLPIITISLANCHGYLRTYLLKSHAVLDQQRYS